MLWSAFSRGFGKVPEEGVRGKPPAHTLRLGLLRHCLIAMLRVISGAWLIAVMVSVAL